MKVTVLCRVPILPSGTRPARIYWAQSVTRSNCSADAICGCQIWGCIVTQAGPVKLWILGVRHADGHHGCCQRSSLRILQLVTVTHAQQDGKDLSYDI